MKVMIFGATGMVGQAALRESLLDPGVERVLTVGRSATGQRHEKLHELVHDDMTDYSHISGELAGYDACFFCVGVSSAGMSEADYRRVTVEIAVAAGRALVKANPGTTFIFVSAVPDARRQVNNSSSWPAALLKVWSAVAASTPTRSRSVLQRVAVCHHRPQPRPVGY